MLEVKDIILLLTEGLDNFTIHVMSDEIESAVVYINNISKIIQVGNPDEIDLLKLEIINRKNDIIKKILDDEVIGLEFRVVEILNSLITDRLVRVRTIS